MLDKVATLPGPMLSLDLGQKRVGVAISDPTLTAITRLPALRRSNWKRLLLDVSHLVRRFDAQALIIGWPLSLNGSQGEAAAGAKEMARKFALSLDLPVFLEDERLTSIEAGEALRSNGCDPKQIDEQIDSESAAIILRDFIAGGHKRNLVSRQANQDL